MKQIKNDDWLNSWFNSPYYQILYKNRSDEEARIFINSLIKKLNISPEAKILDLACGKGRHAIYLNKLGYETTGIDIAPANIDCASRFCNKQLNFEVHDMRYPYKKNYFHYVFNLFSSFGYFINDNDNLRVLQSINYNLLDRGFVVIDFLNIGSLQLVDTEKKSIDGVEFKITKYIEGLFIIKKINIRDQSKQYNFMERLQLLSLNDFENYFRLSGFKMVNLFGDYQMNDFSLKQSPRLIMLGQKTNISS
jgi:SAM-dependent methyltransferase